MSRHAFGEILENEVALRTGCLGVAGRRAFGGGGSSFLGAQPSPWRRMSAMGQYGRLPPEVRRARPVIWKMPIFQTARTGAG